MMESPRRVTPATGNPVSREMQRQATLAHSVPVERQEGNHAGRYALGREVVLIDFSLGDDGNAYVANGTKTIPIRLGHKPTGFSKNWVSPGTIAVSETTSILVYPVARTSWTETRIQVACNHPGAAGVQCEIEVY